MRKILEILLFIAIVALFFWLCMESRDPELQRKSIEVIGGVPDLP